MRINGVRWFRFSHMYDIFYFVRFNSSACSAQVRCQISSCRSKIAQISASHAKLIHITHEHTQSHAGVTPFTYNESRSQTDTSRLIPVKALYRRLPLMLPHLNRSAVILHAFTMLQSTFEQWFNTKRVLFLFLFRNRDLKGNLKKKKKTCEI